MTDRADTPPPLIMIIRHGEKPGSDTSHGTAPGGGHDPTSLTVAGWVRAGALVELFAPLTGNAAAGLRRPDAIYASASKGGHSKRAIQTVTPLAARLGLDIDRSFANGHERKLAEELLTHTGATLVSWHHETIHKIAHHLGAVLPEPPRKWPKDRFDVVWTFTRSDDGWTFDQVPELVMPDDVPDPIGPATEETG